MVEAVLSEVAPGVFGYFQPDGSWGLSNAGLVLGKQGKLLVDTLFDYRHTRRMLDAMSKVGEQPLAIDVVVNTHANGDHCYGNALLQGSRIVASEAARREMAEMPPDKLAALMRLAKGLVALGPARRPLGALVSALKLRRASELINAAPYVVKAFGRFDFRGIQTALGCGKFTSTCGGCYPSGHDCLYNSGCCSQRIQTLSPGPYCLRARLTQWRKRSLALAFERRWR